MVLRLSVAAASLLLVASPVAALVPGIGDAVRNTTFTTAHGQTMSMGDLRGEVVVVTYWTKDCEACDAQLKTLDYYYRQRRDVGLRVLAVSADDMSVRQMKAAFRGKLIHPVASIGSPFEPSEGLPTTYVIDRSGQVRHIAREAIGIEQLNQILVPLLRQPQP